MIAAVIGQAIRRAARQFQRPDVTVINVHQLAQVTGRLRRLPHARGEYAQREQPQSYAGRTDRGSSGQFPPTDAAELHERAGEQGA
jgi:hypothetical protein